MTPTEHDGGQTPPGNKPPANQPPQTGLIAWFATNHVAANLLMILIIAVGALSAFNIKRDLQPDLTVDIVQITVPYPGASPSEVEQGITIKIEDVIQDVEGIEEFASFSRENGVQIFVDILNGFDVSDVMNEIKNRVDGITNLPEEAEKPLVSQMTARYPAIQIQVHGDIKEKTLQRVMREIRQELLQLRDISVVDMFGLRDYEISVEVSEEQLRKYHLTLRDVAAAINNSSLDMAGGSIRSKSGDILLRTKGQAFEQKAFEKIVLKTFPDGTRLMLGDIAYVRDEFVQGSGLTLFDNQYGAGMLVYAIGEQDIIKTADAAKAFIEKKRETLPDNIKLTTWVDTSHYLKGRLQLMTGNLAMGAFLVFLILTLFLNFKLAFWVMAGLPVCFLGTIALLPLEFINVTLNMMSLFGFIMVLGIMVDDAIIIGESIDSRTRREGHSLYNVIGGARAVALPATFGVLTTVVAFVPTVSLSGVFAPMPAAFGWVVILCLLFSLVESKLILPAHIAHSRVTEWPVLRTIGFHADKISTAANAHLDRFVAERYLPFLKTALQQRYTTLASFVAALIVTFGVLASGIVVFSLMPQLPSDFIDARIEMIEGTPDDKTFEAIGQINRAIYAVEQEYIQETGDEQGFLKHVSAWARGGKDGEFMVELTKNEDRAIDSYEIVERWREKTGDIPGTKSVSYSSTDESFGDPISFKLIGDDMEELTLAVAELEQIIGSYEGVYDVKSSLSNKVDELNLSIKPGAEALGLSLRDLGMQIREGFYGVEAQRVQRGDSEVKVMVRYPRDERRSLADLDNVHVRTPDRGEVPFHSVASVTTQPGYSAINRIDGNRAIKVSGKIDALQYNPDAVNRKITENDLPGLLEKYPSTRMQLDGLAEESYNILIALFTGLGVALIGVYSLLAIPLKSYTQPLVIMSVIPFSMIGAIIGHMIYGAAFSMMSFFGIIALTGVVVNDSLILIHSINGLRDQGVALVDAVIQAARGRFRAILLTSTTTFFGLYPMLQEDSLQAQDMVPMAISLAFGIVFATLITLVLNPCLCLILEDIKARFASENPAAGEGLHGSS